MTSPHNNSTDTSSLESFTTFMLAHRADLVDAIARRVTDEIEMYRVVPLAEIRARTDFAITPYYTALEQNNTAPLVEYLNKVLSPQVTQQLSLDVLFQTTTIYRSELLELGLRGLVAQVPNATDGVRRVMQLVDEAMQTITQIYQRQLLLFQALAEYAPDGIGVGDLNGNITYVNPAMRQQVNYGPELVGKPITTLTTASDVDKLLEVRQSLLTGGVWKGQLTYQRSDGSTFVGDVSSYMLRDHANTPLATVAIVRDISKQIHDEEERRQLQDQVIFAQQAALAELSTPIIPISDKVMVMPLIGSIDSARAQQIVERLLEGVVSAHANTAIIDITGVPVVDTQVAQALLRAAQAASLVGAKVVLTGIRPEVAQTIVGLGLVMNELVTRGTLQSGIAYALGRS